MLQLNGDNISTLGQAYLEVNWKGLIDRLYRQTLDAPYLNKMGHTFCFLQALHECGVMKAARAHSSRHCSVSRFQPFGKK
jgi:hypothetical protein